MEQLVGRSGNNRQSVDPKAIYIYYLIPEVYGARVESERHSELVMYSHSRPEGHLIPKKIKQVYLWWYFIKDDT